MTTNLTANSQPRVWVVDGLTKVFADTQPGEHPLTSVSLTGAAGECEVAQLAIQSPQGDLVIERPQLDQLASAQGVIPGDRAIFRFVDLVPVRYSSQGVPAKNLLRIAPGYFPDPMCLEDRMIIPAGQTRSIWVRIKIPAETRAGEYSGTITVKSSERTWSVPVKLTVWPIQLPERIPFSTTLWVWPGLLAKYHCVQLYSEAFWQVMKSYAREMADHRQNTIFSCIVGADGLIDIARNQDGSFAFDFQNFDRWVEMFFDAGFEQIEGGHLFDRAYSYVPILDRSSGKRVRIKAPCHVVEPHDEPEYFAIVKALLPALRNHLREKGWLDRYLQHIYDEPNHQQLPAYAHVVELVRSIWPEVVIVDAADIEPAVFDHVDVRVPLIDNTFAFKKTDYQQPAEGRLWAYTCNFPRGNYPNSYLDQPLSMTRVLFWLFWRYGIEGFLYYAIGYWESQHAVPRHNFDPYTGESADLTVLYNPWLDPSQNATWRCPPGSWGFAYPPRDPVSLDPKLLTPHLPENFERVRRGLPSQKEQEGPLPQWIRPMEGVVGSIRWEQLREGVEDYGLLCMLHERIKKAEQSPQLRSVAEASRKKLRDILDRVALDWATYTRDPADIEWARREVAGLIISLDATRDGSAKAKAATTP